MIVRRLALRVLLTALIVASVFTAVALPVSAGSIWLNVSSGTVGSSVQVNGDTFNAADTGYTVFFDAVIVQSGSVVGGRLTTTAFTVPPAVGGLHDVRVLTGLGEEVTLQFTVTPRLNLVSGTSGKVGESFSVNGDGFRGGAAVTINFDTAAAASATASVSGILSGTPVPVPISAWGTHDVTATDGTATTARIPFMVIPGITLSPVSGGVGDAVNVSGSGFAAGSPVTILFDNMQQASTLASAQGSFSGATFQVPNAARGSHSVSAQDSGAHTALANFSVDQQASVSPATGTVGTSVSIGGSGFAASVPLTVKFAGEPVTTVPPDLTTRSDGAFSGNFAVPATASGTFLVEISDGTYSVSSSFQVIARVTTSADGGNVGDNVTISGNGFIAGSTISITFDTAQVAFGNVTADGSFSMRFMVPSAAGGEHVVAATDGENTLTSAFTVESTAPEAPLPLFPLDDEKGDASGPFSWQPVTDPSGVSYTLEISQDSTFGSALLSRAGLADPSYTLTASEALDRTGKDAAYYWRVRAVDGASNIGPWSAPQSFRVGRVLQMPQWVLYLIGAVIAVVFFTAGFMLGRKVAYF